MARTSEPMNEVAVWPALAQYWHPVAYAHEVTDKPVPLTLLGEKIIVCRLGNEVQAFADLCVHRGTPLSLGWIEGEEIICAYHGWSYNREGECTRIPSIPPEHPIPKKGLPDPLSGPRAIRHRLGLPVRCAPRARPRIPGL